jgi:hypothetical protein
VGCAQSSTNVQDTRVAATAGVLLLLLAGAQISLVVQPGHVKHVNTPSGNEGKLLCQR